MRKPYLDMNFLSLYNQPKVASLGDLIVLNDNFDSPIHLDPKVNSVFKGTASKLVSTIIVLLCIEGEINLSNNMKNYKLCKNDVIINRSGSMGCFYGMSEDAKFLLLIINNNFYFPVLSSGDSPELQGIMVTHPVCHLTEQTTQAVQRIYNVLKDNLNTTEKNFYITEIAKGLVHSFMFTILSSLILEVKDEQRKHKKITRGQDLYNRFLQLVENNYMRERDIQYYADKLCLTPKYLSQIIFKESGSYAGEHIKRYVILEAKMLIRSRQYTFLQICSMLNFNSQSFFTKYFKNATGMSPTQYQNT